MGPIVTNSTITHSYATSHNSGATFGGAVYLSDVTLTNSSVSVATQRQSPATREEAESLYGAAARTR
jgi:hypothetical protein